MYLVSRSFLQLVFLIQVILPIREAFPNVKTIPYLYVFLYIPLWFFLQKDFEIDISTIFKHVPRECIYYSIISHIYWCLLCIRLHAETIGCMKQVHAIWVLKS